MRITFPKVNIINKSQKPIKKQAYATNPISFQAQCSVKDFKLKEIPNLHCPVCGLVMLNDEQRKAFIDDVAPKTGENLIEALTKYEDETALVGEHPRNEHKTIYRPLKAKIIEVIKQTAKQYPKLNLLQIVRLKRNEFLTPLIKQQLAITAELEEYLESVELTEEERKTIKGIISEYKSQILGESDVEFKRKNYIHALSNVTDKPEIQAKISEIIERLPQSKNDVNSFFVKYSKEAKSSREIASKFVNQSIPTAEHLKPKSKGGKNNTNNYICDCAECNSARFNTDFDIWLEQVPELAQNLQKYVDEIQEIIDDGNFPVAYDSYVEEIIKTISELSHGKLKLKTPKSNNRRINDAVFIKRQNELENIKKAMSELYRKKEELKEKIRQLEDNSQFYNIVQLELVKKQIENAEKRLATLNKDLANYQQTKKESLSILDEITLLQIRLANGDETTRERIIELDEKSTKQKLNEAEAKIKVTQSTIETLTNNLTKLRKKERSLTRLVVSADDIDKQIKDISEILANYNSINYKIGVLKESIFDEDMINDLEKEIKKDIVDLRLKNYHLRMEYDGDITKDRTQYETYLGKLKLFQAGDEIVEYSKQSVSKLPPQTSKLIEIAQDSLRNELEKLLEDKSVQYFVNIDNINSLREEREILKERLDEINEIKKQIEALEVQANNVLNGKTPEELNNELERLTKTKTTVIDIKRISELRTELEILEDTISYNENILKQLRNFKDMSPEEFQEYINMIFY